MRTTFAIALAASAFALAATPGFSASLQVAPTTIDLPAKGGHAVLYVTNNGKTPIGVQLEGFEWSQLDGADRLTPSKAIQVSPPMTELKPGERQTIRLRTNTQAGREEHAFRVVASELPDHAALPHTGVEFLFQFSVPVFVGHDEADKSSHSDLAWSLHRTNEGSVLTVHNASASHAKLSDLKLTPASGNGFDVGRGSLIYVLAGATRSWKVDPAATAPGEKLRIVAYDDRTRHSIGAPVSVVP